MIEKVRHKLEGKKVLFIACKFYHYGEAVHEKLKSYGAEVTFYYERDTTFRHAFVANFFPSRMDEWQDRHYRKILQETATKEFDYVIVIRGYKMKDWFIHSIKKSSPNAFTILYQWDSFKAWDSDYRHLIPLFDKTLTFDYKDSASLAIPYAPTFHTDEYSRIEEKPQVYDFIFCSHFTSEKHEFMKRFVQYASQKGYKVLVHLYISRFNYFLRKIKGKDVDYSLISFRRLSRQEYFNLFCKSKTIVDFSSTAQTGITMRVIDALGSGKRVLTNNVNVMNEPGYNPDQIVVYDADNFALPENITQEVKFKGNDYSIDKWLENIFFATYRKQDHNVEVPTGWVSV